MINIKKQLCICFFTLFISGTVFSQENPAGMFTELFVKYKNLEFEKINVDSRLNDGMGIYIYDINKKVSKDIFCQVVMFATLGQTKYLVYNKDGENIWYFHKESFFYEAPYKLENAEIKNTYFKYTNDSPYVFNEKTFKYDIQADTDKYQAIVDVRSLMQLIDVIQSAINNR
jgi:hypothetical protein